MNKDSKQLMNFRIPTKLKHDFNLICNIKNTAMTYELLNLIKGFIKQEVDDEMKYQIKIQELKQQQEPETNFKRWGSLVYDIKNSKWLTPRT